MAAAPNAQKTPAAAAAAANTNNFILEAFFACQAARKMIENADSLNVLCALSAGIGECISVAIRETQMAAAGATVGKHTLSLLKQVVSALETELQFYTSASSSSIGESASEIGKEHVSARCGIFGDRQTDEETEGTSDAGLAAAAPAVVKHVWTDLTGHAIKGGWKSLVGLRDVKEALTNALVLPRRFPSLFGLGGRCPPQRILLLGPPGTGKSAVVAACAIDAEALVWRCSPSDVLSKWFGQSERAVKQLFADAAVAAASSERPVVLFLDEVDSFCRMRRGEDDETIRRLKNTFLQELDAFEGVISERKLRVIVVAATNCPWELDPAAIRRFDKRIFVPLPSFDDRLELVRKWARAMQSAHHQSISLSDHDMQAAAMESENLSCAEIMSALRNAGLNPVSELQEARAWTRDREQRVKPATKADDPANVFEARLHNFSQDDLAPLRTIISKDLTASWGAPTSLHFNSNSYQAFATNSASNAKTRTAHARSLTQSSPTESDRRDHSNHATPAGTSPGSRI